MLKLEHDPQLIERLALMHEGNAKAHMKRAAEQHEVGDAPRSGWSQHDVLAASGFVIAASYWSLIAPRTAMLLYRSAAEIYRARKHSYWMVLALASASENEIATMPSVIDGTLAPGPQTVAFAMVGNAMSDSDRQGVRAERLDTHWRHVGNVPIGRLGIPLDHYARCAQAMRVARAEKNIEYFLAEVANYVHRAAEVLRSASHDRFHWMQLQSTILPAEPEAVAMTTAMSMMSHQIFGIPISDMPDLDAHGRLLVETGDEMRNAARGENERHR
jgi:hypothetical protein